MVTTKIRLITFLQSKKEKLYTDSKRDTDVKNRLLDSVGEEDGMI